MNKIHITYLAFSVKFIEICSFIYSFIINKLFSSSYSVQDYFWLDRYSTRMKAVLERGTVPFAAPLELTHVPTTGASTRQETVQQWKMSEGLESQCCLFPRRFIKLRREGQRMHQTLIQGKSMPEFLRGNEQKEYVCPKVCFQSVYSHKMSWSQPVRIGACVF